MTDVRLATTADARAIGEAHAAAWRAAYEGHMPAEFLAGLRAEDYQQRWSTALEAGGEGGVAVLGTTRARVLVACDDARVVGFAAVGEFRDDPAPDIGELWAINLAPASWGTGVGAALLAACEGALRDDKRRRAVLWVLDGNARARRFYERHGWRPTEEEKVDESRGFPLRELLYAKPVGDPAP